MSLSLRGRFAAAAAAWGLNFGGISDRAVDLQKNLGAPAGGSKNSDLLPFFAIDPIIQGCQKDEGEHVSQAWREAGELAYLHRQWSPKGKWQNAMDLYMGTGSRGDYGWQTGPGPVQKNIRRASKIHSARWFEEPRNTYAWFYCHEEDIPGFDPADRECGANTTAFTWDDPGAFSTYHYVALCPLFWNFTRTMSLRDADAKADGDIKFQMTMEEWKPVRARIVLHESYHWASTVSDPPCRDLEYKPKDVCDLAREQGTEQARLNAESFAQAALAIYIMDTWHHANPPTPGGVPYPPPAGMPQNTKNADIQEIKLDAPPAGWIRPLKLDDTTGHIDPSLGAVSLSTFGRLESSSQG